MKRPIIQHHDLTTDTIELREMNDEEFDAYRKQVALDQQLLAEKTAKQNAREAALAKLTALGLTEDEIAAL